jgi:glycosyltransferase involved in cell wall biosynthesis
VDVAIVAEQLRRRVPGGIGTYIRGLVQGLRQLGPEAPAAELVASRTSRRPDPLQSLGLPVRTISLPSRLLGRAWDLGLGPSPAAQVVHATSLVVPWQGNGPRVVMVHDLVWRSVPEAFPERGRRWHEAAFGRALTRAALLLVPSEDTAAAVRDAGARRVMVIEEGSDHLPPPDATGASAFLTRLGVHGPYVMTLGTLEPRKNLHRLLAAYRLAQPQLPEPWPLVVIGPAGWGRAAQPTSGAVFGGHVPDAVLAALLAGARCVAYVPLLEGFGLPAVEAMRAATPVVASPMPSTAGAALEVDPLDVEAIAAGLVTAAIDGRRRAELVAAGRARADALTWEAAARAHVQAWESVLA